MANIDVADVASLILLQTVYETAERLLGRTVSINELRTRVPCDPENSQASLQRELRRLVDQGLLYAEESLGAWDDFVVTRSGMTEVERLERAQSDNLARFRQLQDDYLGWLYMETEVEGRQVSRRDYMDTAPRYLGSQYTSAEVDRAIDRLVEDGYVIEKTGRKYSSVPRATVTWKGREVIEGRRSVHDAVAVPPSVTYVTNVHGNANIANGGTDVTQIQTNIDWGGKVSRVLDEVAGDIALLPSAVVTKVQPLIDEARAGIQQREPRSVRRLLTRIGECLRDTGTNAVGSVLAAQVLAVLPLIPM